MPSWKKVILSGSDAALNSLDVTTNVTITGSLALSGSLIDYTGTAGTPDQILFTTSTGVEWRDNIANSAQDLIITGKNVTLSSIPKGTPVYFTGSGTSGNVVGIIPADAGNPNLMPAGGVTSEAIATGAEGGVYIYGYISGVNTSAFAAGDDVFVAVGGGYTNVKPTGSALIQKLGNVEKVDSTNGSGVIQGPSWYNDLPNVQTGYTWVGNSNSVPQAVSTSSLFVTSASFAITASAVNTTPASNNQAYDLIFVANQTAGTQQVRTDDNGNITFNPTTGTLTVPTINGNATTATSASYALSASYAATSSVAFTGNNFVGTGVTYLDNLDLGSSIASGASTTSVTSSLVTDNTTNFTIFTLNVNTYEALFIDYVIYDLAKTNKRTGNLRLTWNTTDTVFDETSTTSIGNTDNFTFSTDNNGTDLKLRATNTTGQDMYIIFEYKLLYIV